MDDGERTVINVVSAHKLSQTTIDKRGYQLWLKGFMGQLKTKLEQTNPERVKPFMVSATEFAKKILSKFNDYDFYISESADAAGQIIILGYGEDGQTPTFYFWKDAIKAEKV